MCFLLGHYMYRTQRIIHSTLINSDWPTILVLISGRSSIKEVAISLPLKTMEQGKLDKSVPKRSKKDTHLILKFMD